ncbi:MAG TPA: glycosyltransferase family 2 protein [Opitutaceae bacterium]|nr:glycosyltransferase family 2 protein [Opitutaceae bacterium]
MTERVPELVVVIPVYNEEDCIVQVLEEWRDALRAHVPDYTILVIDDGSTDNTLHRLQSLQWAELKVHSQVNKGHGQSCLVGYTLAFQSGAQYVFQIDSDGQCDPAGFPELWSKRNEAAAIYGRRIRRDDGVARKVITVTLRAFLKVLCRTKLNDANVPFRIYRAELAASTAEKIPKTFDLANIAVALLMEPLGFIEVPIRFRDRLGGHPSVKWWGFARKARRLLADLQNLRKSQTAYGR